ncbi:MAG: aromatic ring-hydroxylating dioxygenase subunit alpha [Proteobacteria bacterium]|nr:aromatic ring-hydroxylating dioxygenase subunit alpha [Pseudomonadota bacterium]
MDTHFDRYLPLERAQSLPSQWYTSQKAFEAELAQVFSKEWMWVGRSEEISKPGTWITAQVGKESVVVTRDFEGNLHAFSNVCRHRAAKVCRAHRGEGSRLRCQYHGWTYDLEGHLKTTPEFEGVENFKKEDNSLPRFHVKTLGPWLFVSLNKDARSFEDQWAPFLRESTPFQIEKMQFVKRVEYSLHCNWKVFIDNYLDGGYHINTLHPALAGVIPYSEYRSELFSCSSLQTAPLKSKEGDGVSQVRKGTAQYWWLFPNLMINLYDGVMDVNMVIPEAVDRCRVIFDFYFQDVSQENSRFIDESLKVAHQVQLEDQDICEEVQKGLQSAYYRSGPFSVSREKTAYHFHQLLAETVNL